MKRIDVSGIIDRINHLINGGILMAEKLIIAQTPQEAVQAKSGDNAYLAGGTEAMRLGSEFACDSYVSLRKTEALREVKKTSGKLEIGASCTFQELIDNEDIPAYLKEALHFMASRTRRNMATIGGNVAVCRDDSFLVPTLLAATASVRLMNKDGAAEEVSLEGFIAGRDKYKGSLILSIILPEDAAVKSARSSNTAQSHARLTAALGKKDGKYLAYAAIKNYGLVKLGGIAEKMSTADNLSEDEITDYLKNDAKIALKDDLLYGGADYRKYLLGITFAQMYQELKG